MYIARQLSFGGVTFDVKEVKLCSSFIEMYDAAVKMVSYCHFNAKISMTHLNNCVILFNVFDGC